MKPIKYNTNIDIIEVVASKFMVNPGKTRPLTENEYYALMVTDYDKLNRSKTDYFNYGLSWIGLEQTSSGQVYISKDYNKRMVSFRGETVIVAIIDKSKCYEL